MGKTAKLLLHALLQVIGQGTVFTLLPTGLDQLWGTLGIAIAGIIVAFFDNPNRPSTEQLIQAAIDAINLFSQEISAKQEKAPTAPAPEVPQVQEPAPQA